MLKCKDLTTDVHALIDGDLGLIRALRVRFHLLICKYCKRYYRQVLVSIGTLQNDQIMKASELAPTESEIDLMVERLKAARRD